MIRPTVGQLIAGMIETLTEINARVDELLAREIITPEDRASLEELSSGITTLRAKLSQ